jgi:hypothetical protein
MMSTPAATSIHWQVGRSMDRRVLFPLAVLGVTLGSFFLTLLFLDTGAPPPALQQPASDRLGTQRLASLAELPSIASQIGLKLATNMHGNIDTLSRIDQRDVMMAGWIADTEGDATPNELLIFVGGSLAARTKTRGERPDVQQRLNLYFGSEKNLTFQVNFACHSGEQPVAVALGQGGRYFGLPAPACP